MARKDYAGHAPKTKRPKPARSSKSARAKAAKQPPKRGRLVLAILLFVGLAGGGGYFLSQVSGTADDSVRTPAPVKPKKLKPKESLPEKPTEVWQYPEDLQKKEVIVEIPEQVESDVRYQMQCGSFRSREQAESMKATIAFQGFTAQIKKTGEWNRVFLGPYKRKRTAEKERHVLKRANITTCEIWLWKG